MSEHARQIAHKLRNDLQSPFNSLEELCAVPVSSLHAFDLTSPSVYARYKPTDDDWQQLNTQDKEYILKVYWVQFQEILATKIVVDWLDQLQRADVDKSLWLPFFCPPKASAYAAAIARLSLSTLPSILANKPVGEKLSSVAQKATPLPGPVKDTSLTLLVQVISMYTLTDYFQDIYSRTRHSDEALLEWQAFLNGYFSLSARISNASGENADIPQTLEWRVFHINVTRQFEKLVHSVSHSTGPAVDANALSYALSKLARSGFMSFENSRTTFWPAIYPSLRRRLLSRKQKPEVDLWQRTIASLSTADFRTFASSLLSYLNDNIGESPSSVSVKQSAVLLSRLFGLVEFDDERMWTTVIKGIFLSKAWNPSMARILSSWIDAAGQAANKGQIQVLPLSSYRTDGQCFFCSAGEAIESDIGAMVREGNHREGPCCVSQL